MDVWGFAAFGWWWVNDAVMDIADDWFAVVVELTFIGMMSEVVFEELCLCFGIMTQRATFAFPIAFAFVGNSATIASAEGSGVAAFVFGVGVRISGQVLVLGCGAGFLLGCGRVVFLQDGFGGAKERFGGRWCFRLCVWWWW